MQDIHSFETSGGGGGRLFAGGGDRRLRHHHHHQDLNCPRCDSSNTKFCYYNNYNLSQPRHFCKSCRRYWTKGGVLRNVPVGGGIRKAKRSNKPKPKTTTLSSDAVAVAAERKPSNAENSSSDSSTPNTTATTTTTDVSGSNSTNSTPATMINFNESSRRFFNIPQSSTPIITTFDPVTVNQSSAGNTSSEIGMFSGMMTSSTDQLQQVNTEHHHVVENHNQWTVETTGFMDQTAEIEGLFDLTGAVDQSYWNQNHWNDNDHDHDHDHHINFIS